MTDPALEQFLATGGGGSAPPDLGDPFADPFAVGDESGMDGTVSCQVCGTQVDAASGAPVGPVDPSAADEAARYVAGGKGAAGEAEMGGIPLL